MTEDSDEPDGIEQIRLMLRRWERDDGEFRSYAARRSDTLKMLGAGNTTGVLAVAVFLTTGVRTGGMLLAAKILVSVFFIGAGAFIFAYRKLYRFELDVDDALLLLRNGARVESPEMKPFVEKVFNRSQGSPGWVATAFLCLILGGLGCGIGLLVN